MKIVSVYFTNEKISFVQKFIDVNSTKFRHASALMCVSILIWSFDVLTSTVFLFSEPQICESLKIQSVPSTLPPFANLISSPCRNCRSTILTIQRLNSPFQQRSNICTTQFTFLISKLSTYIYT